MSSGEYYSQPDEFFNTERNNSSINNTSLSLVLSLRIKDHFLLQNRFNFEACLTTDDMQMEEILNNPFLSNKINNEDQSRENSTSCFPSFILNQPIFETKIANEIEVEDSIPVSAKQLESIERRKHRHNLQREIITLAKRVIKPAYKNRYITKDNYKTIMKKVVTKATYSNKIDEKWINKTINSYVRKYRTV